MATHSESNQHATHGNDDTVGDAQVARRDVVGPAETPEQPFCVLRIPRKAGSWIVPLTCGRITTS